MNMKKKEFIAIIKTTTFSGEKKLMRIAFKVFHNGSSSIICSGLCSSILQNLAIAGAACLSIYPHLSGYSYKGEIINKDIVKADKKLNNDFFFTFKSTILLIT